MVGAYLRVSTDEQSVSSQRHAINRACKARGLRVTLWYLEKAGGEVLGRVELARAREDARTGKLRQLFVFKLDRLSRGGILETLNLVREFRAHGCELETIGDGFSLQGPGSEMIMAVFAWFSEQERKAIRQRLIEARAAIEADGGSWGRPRKADRPTVKRMHQMKADGRSVREIAIALKVGKSTVQRALTSENYLPKRRPIH